MARRLLRCFLLLIFIPTLSRAGIFAPAPDCLNDVLNGITGKVSKGKITQDAAEMLKSGAHYNDEIFKTLGYVEKENLTAKLDEVIDQFSKYDQKFYKKSELYKHWIKENPGTIKPDTKIGDYLNERYQKFNKVFPDRELKKIASELPEELKKIALECKANQACNEKKIEGLLARTLNDSCLGTNKSAAMRSMITGMALTNGGYFMSYAQNPEEGYPYDMMVNNLLWTPIVSEMGCRNTLAKGEIGKKVDFGQINRIERFKTGVNNYVSYMVISPLTEVSYVAFHTTQQLNKGEKEWKDISIKDLSKQVASLTVWDAVYPVPRMVLVTDPLFMKGFPKLKSYYGKKIPNKYIAETAYTLTDASSRIGISWANTWLIKNAWFPASDHWWDTKFLTTPSPTPEPQK
jgi:hypothetical protein